MKKAKRLLALTIVVLMIVSSLTACVHEGDTATININISSDTLEKGGSIVVSAVASNGKPFTLDVDRKDIVEIANNNIRVKDGATITADVEVTLTATLNDDPTVTATKKFTVKADVEKVKISLNCSKNEINVNEHILLLAMASDNSAVRIRATGDNANLVKIENDVLSVVGEITMDTPVMIVAELVSDPTIYTTKVITIKGPDAGSWIKITANKYTITQASDGYAIVHVSTYNKGEYTVTISGNEGNIAYYNPNSERLMVLKDVDADRTITLTATLDNEPNVKDSVTITVSPAPVIPTITISTKDNATSVSKDSDLALNVKVSTDEAYDLTVSDSALVAIEGAAGSEKLTVIGNNTFDRTITVTATLRSDPTVKTTKTFIVNAPRVPNVVSGAQTQLTTEMFNTLGAQSMTVSGTVNDYYKNFPENYELNHVYDIVVKMEDGKWYGAWNAILADNVKGIVNEDTYIRSDETAIINGVEGHVMKRVYVNMNNELAQKSIIDYRSVPVLWENQHLWNHFGVDVVDNYAYREAESTEEYEVYEFIGNKNSEDIAYYLTYLAYAYTPMVEDTFDRVYLKVDIATNKIIGMLAYTEFLYVGADSEDHGATSVSYSIININFTDIGTTTVPQMHVYDAPENASYLQAAIDNMKNATNYTFKAIDTQTQAPTIDDSDYTLDGVSNGDKIQTLSVSYNYPAAESPLGNGAIGWQGYVTNNAILIKSTFKYSASMDENVYKIENFGYYQKNDTHFDYFEYSSDLKGFQGKQQYAGNIADRLPKWNFSANVFEFAGYGGTGATQTYKFTLRDGTITRDIAMAVSMHNYATDGSDSVTRRFTIEVTADGKVVSTMYPYSITSGTYMGYITTTYSNVGTTTIAEEEFADYAPRVVSPLWSAYSLRYYHPDHDTRSPYAEGTGETILKIMFKDQWTDFPPFTVFTDAFGDSVHGPFFEWRDIENPNGGDTIYKDYFSLTADTEDYDENMEISNETYERIMAKLEEGLAKYGFTRSFRTAPQDPADRSDRYFSFMNEDLGCQIVVENNHTKNFWIDVGYFGDWSF